MKYQLLATRILILSHSSKLAMLCVSNRVISIWLTLQILKPADKKKFPYGGLNAGRPVTPPRNSTSKNKGKA